MNILKYAFISYGKYFCHICSSTIYAFVCFISQSQQYVYVLRCKSLYQLLNRKVHRARVKEDCACESHGN